MPTRDQVYVELIAETQQAMGRFGQFGAMLKSLITPTTLAAAGVTLFIAEMKKSVAAYLEAEVANTKLAAALKATGGAVGLSQAQMNAMAGELQKVTRYSDDAVTEAQGLLVTFTQIGRDTFPRALRAAMDISTMFGQTLSQSAIQLGTALNDPVAGVGRLLRIGVSFTDAQREVIKSFTESGEVARAQAVILDELEREFGGVAKAAGETAAGSIDRFRNALDELREARGEDVAKALSPLAELLATMAENAAAATKAMSAFEEALGKYYAGTETAESKVARLEGEMQQLRDSTLLDEPSKQARLRFLAHEIEMLKAGLAVRQAVETAAQQAAAAEAERSRQAEAFAKRLGEAWAETEPGKLEAMRQQIEEWRSILMAGGLEDETRARQIVDIIVELERQYSEALAKMAASSAAAEALIREYLQSIRTQVGELPEALPKDKNPMAWLKEVTPEDVKVIERVRAELEAQQEALDATAAKVRVYADIWNAFAADLGGALARAITDAESAAEAFKDAFKAAIAAILKMFAQSEMAQALAALASLNPLIAATAPGHFAAAALLQAAAGFVQALEKGGIVTRPTLALIGEAGPEAVVPLSRGGAYGMGGPALVQNFYIKGSLLTERQLMGRIAAAGGSRGY